MPHTHTNQPVLQTGAALSEADRVMILVHGRGASAEGIVGLADALGAEGFAILAPQANRRTWYPNSFLAALDDNEPGLSTGLGLLERLVSEVEAVGVPAERIILGGFSQGACLASEFVARNARRYGGLLVFSGGLIGPPGTPREYAGSLEGTPVFIGCSDVDAHVPVERVRETAEVLGALGAEVDLLIVEGMGHTIIPDEVERAQAIVRDLIA